MMNAETQLLYSSDYPHWDMDLPSTIYDLPFLSEQAKRNILGENARKLFKLEQVLSETKLLRKERAGPQVSCHALKRPLLALSGHPTRSAPCPLLGGAFNRSVQHQSQSIGRGFEAQGLSRALIEPQRN